jgi:hypothetical protein
MLVSAAHRDHWRRRRKAEAALILRARWPEIHAVWLFGSVLETSCSLLIDTLIAISQSETWLTNTSASTDRTRSTTAAGSRGSSFSHHTPCGC